MKRIKDTWILFNKKNKLGKLVSKQDALNAPQPKTVLPLERDLTEHERINEKEIKEG